MHTWHICINAHMCTYVHSRFVCNSWGFACKWLMQICAHMWIDYVPTGAHWWFVNKSCRIWLQLINAPSCTYVCIHAHTCTDVHQWCADNVCCVTQQAVLAVWHGRQCPLCDTADNVACCVTQQTMLAVLKTCAHMCSNAHMCIHAHLAHMCINANMCTDVHEWIASISWRDGMQIINAHLCTYVH